VTDAGLYYLKGLSELEELSLGGSQVTGPGLALLAGLTRLRKLQLPYGNFPVEQLAPLAALVNLEEFNCNLTTDTAAKLKIMAPMTKLLSLSLQGTQFSPLNDDCLVHVGKMIGLENLFIISSVDWRVSDAALAHLKNLTRLKMLSLPGAAITEAGLQHIQGFANLETLD